MANDPLSPVFDTEPHVDTFALATVIYAEREDGKILLLERAEGTAMAGFFFLPGGVVDPGETPFAATARELQEESGLAFAAPPTMVGCYQLFAYGHPFLNLSFRGPVAGDMEISSEHTAHKWVTPQEWAGLFTKEMITSSAAGNEQVEMLLTGIGADAQRYLNIIN